MLKLYIDRAVAVRVDGHIELKAGKGVVLGATAKLRVVLGGEGELVYGPVPEVVGILFVVVEEGIERISVEGPPARQVGVDPHRHNGAFPATAEQFRQEARPPQILRFLYDARL